MNQATKIGVASILTLYVFSFSLHLIAAQQDHQLVITSVPDQNRFELHERFDKLAKYLEQVLGIPVRYIPSNSYDDAVLAFRNNKVQLAWFGGLSGLRARMLVPGSQAIAQGKEDQSFRTYFIAHSSTGLKLSNDLSAVAGYPFTFGSRSSTSGRLMPEHFIRQTFGEPSESVFKYVGYSGDHTSTITAVRSGRFKVGAVNYKVWEKELERGNIDLNEINVVWVSPPYPDYQWSIRANVTKIFGQNIIKKVTSAIIAMENEYLLDTFPRSRFISANNNEYLPLRQIAEQLGFISKCAQN